MTHFAFSELNIWAILVAGVLNMAIGASWYSEALFGKKWMAYLGFKKEELNPSAGLFVFVFILGLLVAHAWRSRLSHPQRFLMRILLPASLFAALDEVYQMLIPGRLCSFQDWLADFAGIIVGSLLYSLVTGRYDQATIH